MSNKSYFRFDQMDPSSLPFFESTLFSSSEKLSGREIQARIEVLALGFLSDLVGRTTATIQMVFKFLFGLTSIQLNDLFF